MTLERWLREATAGLPPEVARRVRAEYAAHVAESGLPEGEAVAALGPPEAVRRSLGRTYLDEERLEVLRDGTAIGEAFPLVLALATSALLAGFAVSDALADGTPLRWWDGLPSALTWMLIGLAWGLTRSAPPERRRLWRTQAAFWSLQFLLWSREALDLWRGEDVVLPWFVPLWGLGLFGWLLHLVHEDRCLRRTLALKEGRP